MKVLFINLDNLNSEIKYVKEPYVRGIVDYGIYLHVKGQTNNYSSDDKRNYFIIGKGYEDKAVFIFRNVLTKKLEISIISGLGKFFEKSGLNGIVFYGKSDKKFFLIIENDNVMFLEENLSENIYEKYEFLKKELENIYSSDFSISLLGLASKNTSYGSLFTFYDKISVSSEGVGSSLYKQHNIIGFSLGGNYEFKEKINLNLDLENKSLYNVYSIFRGNLPYLNYQNIYLNREEREKFFMKFLEEKISDVKMPFEVFHIGPFLGIFDINLIKELVNQINKFGFNAKYLAYILGAVMEGIYRKYINYDKVPVFDIKDYVEDYSLKNYEVASSLIEDIALNKLSILGNNIRYLTKKLNIKDIAFYIPIGNEYDSVPIFLISLGLIFPNMYYDKYFTDYEIQNLEPEDYAKLCLSKLKITYSLHNGKENEFWIKHLFEYNKDLKPEFFESKRTLDYVNFLFKEIGMKYSLEEYWNRWFNSYFSSI
mgnify:CR=1 FL=1